jgi:hypothetical protein
LRWGILARFRRDIDIDIDRDMDIDIDMDMDVDNFRDGMMG